MDTADSKMHMTKSIKQGSLLRRAKEFQKTLKKRRSKIPDDDVVEIAICWLKREIMTTAIGQALGYDNAAAGGVSIYSRLLSGIRRAYDEGKITIK